MVSTAQNAEVNNDSNNNYNNNILIMIIRTLFFFSSATLLDYFICVIFVLLLNTPRLISLNVSKEEEKTRMKNIVFSSLHLTLYFFGFTANRVEMKTLQDSGNIWYSLRSSHCRRSDMLLTGSCGFRSLPQDYVRTETPA